MSERLSVSGGSRPYPSSSEWIDILEDPAHSGVAVYRSPDGRYYLGLSYRLFWFDPSSRVLHGICNADSVPARTPLGQQLSLTENRQDWDAIDPGAQSLFEYVDADELGMPPASPPPSRYYADLTYLGRFGVIRAEGRGQTVGFSPADKSPEPRLALEPYCG